MLRSRPSMAWRVAWGSQDGSQAGHQEATGRRRVFQKRVAAAGTLPPNALTTNEPGAAGGHARKACGRPNVRPHGAAGRGSSTCQPLSSGSGHTPAPPPPCAQPSSPRSADHLPPSQNMRKGQGTPRALSPSWHSAASRKRPAGPGPSRQHALPSYVLRPHPPPRGPPSCLQGSHLPSLHPAPLRGAPRPHPRRLSVMARLGPHLGLTGLLTPDTSSKAQRSATAGSPSGDQGPLGLRHPQRP